MAEYTRFDRAELRTVLAPWGIDVVSAFHIDGGMANTSYLVNDAYVLTALDNHDAASASTLVRTARFIATHGGETPQPIESRNGRFVELNRGRPVILKPYLETRRPPSPEMDRAEGVGALLASLHALPSPDFLPPRGRRIPDDALEMLDGHRCQDLRNAIDCTRTNSFDAILGSHPVALCHGDLMGDNILELRDGRLVAIDWETATVDSTVLDIGISTVTAVKHGIPVPEFLEQLLDGYRSAAGVAPSLHEAIAATAYACVLMSYHRYVRQNIRYPDPLRADIYKELLPFVFANC